MSRCQPGGASAQWFDGRPRIAMRSLLNKAVRHLANQDVSQQPPYFYYGSAAPLEDGVHAYYTKRLGLGNQDLPKPGAAPEAPVRQVR